MERSKKLARQIKKAFSVDSEESFVAQLKQHNLADSFASFLDSIEEAYSQLEEKVVLAERTLDESSKELFALNQTFDSLVNSLGQGFLLFGRDRVCHSIYSKACESLLCVAPAQKNITDILKIGAEQQNSFNDWINMLFDELIPFEDLSALGPSRFNHPEGKVITLEYKPVRDKDGLITYIVLIATDKTEEFKALKKLEEMNARATMLSIAFKDKDYFKEFILESRKVLNNTKILLAGNSTISNDKSIEMTKRNLHTIKGLSGSFGFIEMQADLHQAETMLVAIKDWNSEKSILVPQIDKALKSFEFKLDENRNVLGSFIDDSEPVREISLGKMKDFSAKLISWNKELKDLRDLFVKEFAAVSISHVFSRFEGPMLKIAKEQGKKVAPIQYNTNGIVVIPENYDILWPTIVHLFRNMIDHGIEKPEERISVGKSEEGHILFSSQLEVGVEGKSFIKIRLSDDGRGIDMNRVKKKLAEKGRADFAQKASTEELLDTLFESGFSTNDKISEISGRGIGMDAVRNALTELGGKIKIESIPGKGTAYLIEIPNQGMDFAAAAIAG